MANMRGGTGLKRGDIYGGNISTRPASGMGKQFTSSARGPQSLGALFPKLTKKIFEKYGFSMVQLVTNWPAIVGSELAQSTRPEKLKWPHRSKDYIDDTTTDQSQFKNEEGATLLLRVEGPRSLEIQFASSQIIERINTFYGYKAITKIRILQAPLPKPHNQISRQNSKPRQADPENLTKNLSKIEDEALRKALYRMAQGVKATKFDKDQSE